MTQVVVLAAWLGLVCPAGAGVDVTYQTASSDSKLPWIEDVAKMSAANVPPEVIKSYVNNSKARSTLRADDIIYLRDRGVSSDIISLMIEHGAATTMAAYTQAAPPTQTAPPPAAVYPASNYSQPVAYADQAPADYAYSYPYAPYNYSYGYGFGYYYPLSYWYPTTTFFVSGFRNHHRESFFRDDRRFRGGVASFGRNTGGLHTVGFARSSAPAGHAGRR